MREQASGEVSKDELVDKQVDRFKKVARELGADESDSALDRIMGKMDLKKPGPEKGKHE
jgi:hypothetical protein